MATSIRCEDDLIVWPYHTVPSFDKKLRFFATCWRAFLFRIMGPVVTSCTQHCRGIHWSAQEGPSGDLSGVGRCLSVQPVLYPQFFCVGVRGSHHSDHFLCARDDQRDHCREP